MMVAVVPTAMVYVPMMMMTMVVAMMVMPMVVMTMVVAMMPVSMVPMIGLCLRSGKGEQPSDRKPTGDEQILHGVTPHDRRSVHYCDDATAACIAMFTCPIRIADLVPYSGLQKNQQERPDFLCCSQDGSFYGAQYLTSS